MAEEAKATVTSMNVFIYDCIRLSLCKELQKLMAILLMVTISKKDKEKLPNIPQFLLILSNLLQVIAAEGEQKASRSLKEASDIISQSPAGLQLRYLQTLTQIAAERNSTIVFPLPIDMMQMVLAKDGNGAGGGVVPAGHQRVVAQM